MVERGNKLRALREELGIYRFQLDLLKLLNRKQMSIDGTRRCGPAIRRPPAHAPCLTRYALPVEIRLSGIRATPGGLS